MLNEAPATPGANGTRPFNLPVGSRSYPVSITEKGPLSNSSRRANPDARYTWWVGTAARYDLDTIGPLVVGITMTSFWQDDLEVLHQRLGYRFGRSDDDHGSSFSNATPLTYVEATPLDQSRYKARGIITRLDDIDVFSVFTEGPALVQLHLPSRPNLHADLELYDTSGNRLGRASAAQSYRLTIPAEGRYYLRVRWHPPTVEETADGYLTYGSVGQYRLTVRETSGPRVIRGWHTRNYVTFTEPMAVRVRFDKPVHAASFSRDQVTLREVATGQDVPVLDVRAEPGAGNTEFYISLGAVPFQGYSLLLKDGIQDLFGNRLEELGEVTEHAGYRDTLRPELRPSAAVYDGFLRVTFSDSLGLNSFPAGQITSLTDAGGRPIPSATGWTRTPTASSAWT